MVRYDVSCTLDECGKYPNEQLDTLYCTLIYCSNLQELKFEGFQEWVRPKLVGLKLLSPTGIGPWVAMATVGPFPQGFPKAFSTSPGVVG